MQPLGCFGSSLAFDGESDVCGHCVAQAECSKIVEDRRPNVLRLLDRFLDASGKPMSFPWMTRAERKAARDAMNQSLPETE
jgi:hypothetical protein